MRGLVLVLLVACMNPKPVVYHPDVISLVDTDSDKAIQIVSDERMREHEPREVPTSSVAAALIASGMFLDDDARTLAEPIAKQLPTMATDEAVRIVGWAADAPRYYYVLIHGGRLQIIYYAGSTQSDTYSAALPTDAVAIVQPHDQPPPPVAAPSDAGVAAAPPPDAAPHVVSPTPVHHKRPAQSLPLITEAEARQKMRELDEALAAGLISPSEQKSRRKEILARL